MFFLCIIENKKKIFSQKSFILVASVYSTQVLYSIEIETRYNM